MWQIYIFLPLGTSNWKKLRPFWNKQLLNWHTLHLDRVIENGRTNLAGLKKAIYFKTFFVPWHALFPTFFRLRSPSLAAPIGSCILFKFKVNSSVLEQILNKRSSPRAKINTAWKIIPHSSKITKNRNPPHWVPLLTIFKNQFFLIQKQLYNEYI